MKNKVSDEEFEQFKKDFMKYIDDHKEQKEMIEYNMTKLNRLKRMLWGKKAFIAWSQGKFEWFMNNSQIEYDNRKERKAFMREK